MRNGSNAEAAQQQLYDRETTHGGHSAPAPAFARKAVGDAEAATTAAGSASFIRSRGDPVSRRADAVLREASELVRVLIEDADEHDLFGVPA